MSNDIKDICRVYLPFPLTSLARVTRMREFRIIMDNFQFLYLSKCVDKRELRRFYYSGIQKSKLVDLLTYNQDVIQSVFRHLKWRVQEPINTIVYRVIGGGVEVDVPQMLLQESQAVARIIRLHRMYTEGIPQAVRTGAPFSACFRVY